MIEVTRAALLAHHGLLGSVGEIHLQDVYLNSVPSEHLAALASCVTGDVHIKNVRGCGLVSILNNLRCEHLIIRSQSLSSDETDALIRATETEKRVKNLDLKSGVSVDKFHDCLYLLPEIAWSANLANKGLLGSVGEIHLRDIDLSSVPPDHLASLASCVVNDAHIGIVKGCSLVGFLDSLKCTNLILHWRIRAGTKEFHALNRATESRRVENVKFEYEHWWSQDIGAFISSDRVECEEERRKRTLDSIGDDGWMGRKSKINDFNVRYIRNSSPNPLLPSLVPRPQV